VAKIVTLSPDEEMPDEEMPGLGEDQRWLTIDASDVGRFFGPGGSFKDAGEWAGYVSLFANMTGRKRKV